MKKIVMTFALFVFISCGSVSRTMVGATEGKLIKTVAIEQNCLKENIKIIEKVKGLHGATYALEVCGKRVIYKQIGSVFMEESKANETIKQISN